MRIPQSENLSTQRMSHVFDKTVATYKFYWFIGILDLYIKNGTTKINIWDIMIEMVANAWYPICYFHLSFGKSESLYEAILKMQKEFDLPINISVSDLRTWLHQNISDRRVIAMMKFLQLNVPYRFLRPWINTSDDKQTELRSQDFENGCPYRLLRVSGSLWIELNNSWLEYLQTNYLILKDFAYWNLVIFLQTRNPNVPNIPNKLIKSETRNSLSQQHHYWDFVISHHEGFHCIYTDNLLEVKHYDLDHFLPWSFVSHDLIWNLIPADGSINSSKNDKLPNLDEYLPKLMQIQQTAIHVCLENDYRSQLLEDYFSLGYTPQELVQMDNEHLYECFKRTYGPLNQIALNMGFEPWKYNRT